MTHLLRQQQKLIRQAQTAFILTHGAWAFYLATRYWAWVEGWVMDEGDEG